MTFVRKCHSHQGDVKGIRKVYQGAWGRVTVVRKCDSHPGGLKGI